MPPKAKKAKGPKVLLAECEAALAITKSQAASREMELGSTILQLASTVTECKALIVAQQLDLETNVDAREKSLRIALASARSRVAELERSSSMQVRTDTAAKTAAEERTLLCREIAELIASREVASSGHAIEKASFTSTLMRTRTQLELVFKETLAQALEIERRNIANQMGADAVAGAIELRALRINLLENARELAGIFQIAEERRYEIDRLVS